jgi:4-hydroxy-tetrahydrodipicolinate reductase
VKVAICGAGGRMGKTLIQACAETPGIALGAAIERSGSPYLGQDAGELASIGPLGVRITDDLESVLEAFDVAVDFTQPEAALGHLAVCSNMRKPAVIGTTGFSAQQKAAIGRSATSIPLVQAPNMSVGVNLCFRLLELAAGVLGDEFDVEILEAHHRHKRDAPSGTSLQMGELIAAVLGRKLEDCAVYGRQGIGPERDAKTIGFATVRGGDIVGSHTALFAGSGECVEITHRATSRLTFARGALRAAGWIVQQPNGLYDMQDVLGLRTQA